MARLLRIKYPAGAKSVMHNHPAGCGIFLVDQKFKLTMANHPIPSASRCSARSIVLPHGVLRVGHAMSEAWIDCSGGRRGSPSGKRRPRSEDSGAYILAAMSGDPA